MFRRLNQIRKLENSKLTDDEYYEVNEYGRGIIDVGAENVDDIFSYYDLNGENILDTEFSQFLGKKASAIPSNVELAIHFHIKEPTEEKCEEIDRAIKNHYKRELRGINRQLTKNTKFTLYLLFLGLLSFGVYIGMTLANINSFVIYIFDLVAYVFLWEVVDNHFIQRRILQDRRLHLYRLIRADIEVRQFVRRKRKKHKKNFNINRENKEKQQDLSNKDKTKNVEKEKIKIDASIKEENTKSLGEQEKQSQTKESKKQTQKVNK